MGQTAAAGAAEGDGDVMAETWSGEVVQVDLPAVFLLRHKHVEAAMRTAVVTTFKGTVALRLHGSTLGVEASCFTGPRMERVSRILVQPAPGDTLPVVPAPVLGAVVRKLWA